jgi:hypothetical protein
VWTRAPRPRFVSTNPSEGHGFSRAENCTQRPGFSR